MAEKAKNTNAGKHISVEFKEITLVSVQHHPLRHDNKKGSRGQAVVDLQNALVKQGFKLTPNGEFGPKTERYLRDFQRRQGLPATGVADPRTLQELAHPGLAHKNAMEVIQHLKVSAADIITATSKRDFTHSKPPSQLSTSDLLFDHLYHAEGGGRAVASGLYWPQGSSGVTVGPGYDMKKRTEKEIYADLAAVDVPDDVARKIAKGAGLSGAAAKKFADDNAGLVKLSDLQQRALLRRKLGDYERAIRQSVHVDLLPHEFDALVSFTYNAGPGAMKSVGARIDKGDIVGALQTMEQYLVKDSDYRKDPLRVGLARRRHDEVTTFLYGHP
jgi:GH24 family phage-related lysozyme (muramidase)/peptidoglycan hydrolase-like protein with peptidoglycan-binding domain